LLFDDLFINSSIRGDPPPGWQLCKDFVFSTFHSFRTKSIDSRYLRLHTKADQMLSLRSVLPWADAYCSLPMFFQLPSVESFLQYKRNLNPAANHDIHGKNNQRASASPSQRLFQRRERSSSRHIVCRQMQPDLRPDK